MDRFCIDCKHHAGGNTLSRGNDVCMRLKVDERDLVSGQVIHSTGPTLECATERYPQGKFNHGDYYCGKEAKYFEEKV